MNRKFKVKLWVEVVATDHDGYCSRPVNLTISTCVQTKLVPVPDDLHADFIDNGRWIDLRTYIFDRNLYLEFANEGCRCTKARVTLYKAKIVQPKHTQRGSLLGDSDDSDDSLDSEPDFK